MNVSSRYRAIPEYYDPEYDHYEWLRHDVPFFLDQLPKRSQRILELAAGTGRAAVPMAQAGHRVMGVDCDRRVLDIAKEKSAVASLPAGRLQLIKADITALPDSIASGKFDWVCIFFNTFLNFTTLKMQDAVLKNASKALSKGGHFWVDIFNPDLEMLSQPESRDLDPFIFYVPSLDRTVFKTTHVRRSDSRQIQSVEFQYTWFDSHGGAITQSRTFDLTWIFPRELQLLVERHGMKVEKMYGNYDGSAVGETSPRIIARCVKV